MNTDFLKTFLSVASTKSFSKSETQLFISKQAIMHQIDLLERDFNAQLLIRTNKGVQLTDAGKIFAQEAQKILSLEQNLFQLIQMNTGKSPSIRLSSIDYHVLLDPVTAVYKRQYPHVTIQKIFHPLTLEAKLVEQNIIDIGDTLYSPRYNEGLLRYEKLLDMHYFCIFPPSAQSPSRAVTPSDLTFKSVLVDYREFQDYYTFHLDRLCHLLPHLEVAKSAERRIETIYTALQNGKVVVTASTFARQIKDHSISELQVDFMQESGIVYRADASPTILEYVALAKKIYRSKFPPFSASTESLA